MAAMENVFSIMVLGVLAVMPTPQHELAPKPAAITAHVAPLEDAPSPEIVSSIAPIARVQPKSAEVLNDNWCPVGLIVMIPDGREARVTSVEGDVCRVLAYGEAYVSLWGPEMIEPVYPQTLKTVRFGH